MNYKIYIYFVLDVDYSKKKVFNFLHEKEL